PFKTNLIVADVDVGHLATTNLNNSGQTNIVRKQRLAIRITLTGPNVVGTLSSPDFVRSGNVYSLSNVVPDQATAAIQAVQYVAPVFPLGAPVQVGLSLQVTDDHQGVATDTNTVVQVVNPPQSLSVQGTQ